MVYYHQVGTVLFVIAILAFFVGCSPQYEEVPRTSPSAGNAAATDSITGEISAPVVLHPTTLYGLTLITIIVLIGVGLWLWEVHEEKVFEGHRKKKHHQRS